MEILAIIPARKNSQRLKNKNIMNLCGKSLIEYAIDEARKSEYIKDICLITDDPEAKLIGAKNNIKIIDDIETPTISKRDMRDVIVYCLERIGYKPDAIVLLQPTTPLRTAKHIDKCISIYLTNQFDSVITVVRSRHSFVYIPNGAVYVFKDNNIWNDNMGFVLMKEEESIDIDTELDFKIVEMMINDNS